MAGRGRESLSGEGKSPTLAFAVSEKTFVKLDKLAARAGLSRAAMAREIFEKGLAA